MIPSVDILMTEITEVTNPTKTFKINHMAKNEYISEPDRIGGFVDDIEAIKQMIYLTLSSERYAYIIYPWDYGIELVDLFGKPTPYVMSELERRITEALLQDDRIKKVEDFTFEQNGKALHVTFLVVTTIGNIPSELEVTI